MFEVNQFVSFINIVQTGILDLSV